MQSIIVGALVTSYIAVAYIGPVAALGLAAYWGYTAYQTGGEFGGAFVTFMLSALVMLVALMNAKRLLKYLMNVVDDDDPSPETQDS